MAKVTKIKSLEDLVIKLGYNSSDVKVTKDIARRKNANITTLKKPLNLTSIEDPQTKEVGELEKQNKDMLKIIMEQNIQIKDMEMEMEKLLKEKEKSSQLPTV